VTRRRRSGFTRGSRRCGAAAFAASFGRKSYGAAAAAHGIPVTGRLRFPPYPAAAPDSTTAKPSASRQMRRSPGRCHSHQAGTPRIVRAGPCSLNGASHPAARDAPAARR
jgi:hypothetical protein